MTTTVNEPTSFWRQVDRSGECWEWTGRLDRRGYGGVSIGGINWRAHRYSWQLVNGPIPDGLMVLHHCDNKRCVRPDHLYVGTHADNTRDAVERHRMASGPRNGMATHPERMVRGERQWNAKLTAADVREIRRHSASGESTSRVASRFGITKQAVSLIVRGERWSHVD